MEDFDGESEGILKISEDVKRSSFVASLAGDTKEGFDDAAALPERLNRYAQAHHRALMMASYIKAVHLDKSKLLPVEVNDTRVKLSLREKQNLNLASEIENCGTRLTFRDYFQIGKVRLHAMHSCKKHMLCPLCAIRRGAKSVKAYLDKLEIIKAEFPQLKAFLVTFTVKNGEDLNERFSHIHRAVKAYHQQRNFAYQGKRSPVEACKASGAVWSYEFKRGKGSGLWHPHVHAIWLCEEMPDQAKIREEWKAITRDSHIVDVRPFHNQDDVVGGFLEVFKYALKFSDMPLDQNWEGYETLQGRRLIGSFGAFRGVQVPEIMTDDNFEDEPYVELFYQYAGGAGYTCTSVSQPKVPDELEREFNRYRKNRGKHTQVSI